MTRERQAHEARLKVDRAALVYGLAAWRAGLASDLEDAAEDAALVALREALTDLYSLATMTDDEFADTVDGAPDTQEQVTTPPEVNAR